MTKKTIKGFLLDIPKNEYREVEFEPTLESYYELIGCDLVEMPTRFIGGKPFVVICDEEGTYRANAKISAIDNMGRAMFVGSLLIANEGNNGKLKSLTEEELKMLASKVQEISTHTYPEGYLMLTDCEYFNLKPARKGKGA